MAIELTIRLPAELHRRLEARARARGQPLDQVVVEELARGLETERERTLEALRSTGLIRPLSEGLRRLIIPGVTHEEVRQILSRTGGKALSEIVIEQREG